MQKQILPKKHDTPSRRFPLSSAVVIGCRAPTICYLWRISHIRTTFGSVYSQVLLYKQLM